MRSDTTEVIDYDANDYDYRGYWEGRDYEHWAEQRVLRRLVPKLGRPAWFADFGGAFGRNTVHYLPFAARSVIMDYSATNLSNAGDRYAGDIASGRLHLVRCDINKVPFRDFSFEAAIVVRVLHHLSDLGRGLTEMSRTIGGSWLLDVPIKHHVLGLARGMRQRQIRTVIDPAPVAMGVTDERFWNFQLPAVRSRLAEIGWRTSVAASVNNFRQWEKIVPPPASRIARPLVQGMEVVAQSFGKGWLGPSQFLLSRRNDPVQPHFDRPGSDPGGLSAPLAELARRVVCPSCLVKLQWTEETACCAKCTAVFKRRGAFWDFVA